MNNSSTFAIILHLLKGLKELGSWCGETHIQKTLFFLETLFNTETDLNFILYKHGPFSFTLKETLDDMKLKGLIQLELVPPYGPKHIVTESGEKFLLNNSEILNKWSVAIQTIVNAIGGKRVVELEKLSTSLLIFEKGIREREDMAIELNRVKPHINLEDARNAITEFFTIYEKIVKN